MVACARDALKDTTYQSRDLIDLQTLGCSKTSDRWTLGAIRMYVMQPAQNSSVFFMVGVGITLSLLASLTVYGIVRRHRLGHWRFRGEPLGGAYSRAFCCPVAAAFPISRQI